MTKLVVDGAAHAAKGAKLNAKEGRAPAEGQQAVDPVTGAALAAPAHGAPQAKVGAAPVVPGKPEPKVDAAKVVVHQDDEVKDDKLQHAKDEDAQPTSQGENLAMVDAASAAAVGMMATETTESSSAQADAGSDGYDDGDNDSTPLIIGGLVVAGGAIAAAAGGGGGGGNGGGTPANSAPTTTAQTNKGNEDTAITGKLTAADANNDTLTYALKTGTTAPAGFTLNSDGSYTLDAKNTAYQSLAAGATKDVVVNFTVSDGKGGTADSTLTVTVTGVNDAPTFANATATATVAENAANTTVVYKAAATDVDTGDTVSYSLSGTDASAFNVNATTGEVTLKNSSDFEAKPSYSFNVVATDKAGATATQAVTLNVTDVNDAPVITSNGGGDTAAINVAENSTAVTTVVATDQDAGATKTYSISGGADAALFDINATTGVLTFKNAPNFEAPADAGANNVYDVVVKVADNGNPALTDTQAIAVTVTNVNEAPAITNAPAADISVPENTATTTVLYDFNASDPDAGTTLSYVLGGADAALFNINAAGELTFKASPNFEAPADAGADNTYNVTVAASDGTLTSSVVPVVIKVTDVAEQVTQSLDSAYASFDNNVVTQDPISAAGNAFLFQDDGNVASNVILNGFTGDDRIAFLNTGQIAASFGTGADPADLRIDFNNGNGAVSTIVINDVLDPNGPLIASEAAANAALNTQLGTTGIDYFTFG